jgi:hypothetical protein
MSEKKKNETKKSDTKRDSVSLEKGKDSNQTSTEKSDSKGKRFSNAGKGDKVRRGVTQDEWGKKWEAIFSKKKKSI